MTFLELQNMVADWLAVDDKKLPTAARRHMINLALQEIYREDRWRHCLHTDQITIAQNQWSMAVPERFLDTKKIVIDDVGPIEFLPSSEFRERTRITSIPTVQTPRYYTIEGNSVIFSGRAPSPMSGSHTYFRALPPLSADGDSNIFTQNYWDLVLFTALANASLFLIEDPRIPLFREKKMEALQKILVGEGKLGIEAARRPQSRIPGV